MSAITVEPRLAHALSTWKDWDTELCQQPEVVRSLNDGISHHSFLISGHSTQGELLEYVVKLDNPKSRELAIPIDAEVELMQKVPSLAPRVVYYSAEVLITVFIKANPWLSSKSLTPLANALRHLHQHQLSSVNSTDLINHCHRYWLKLGAPEEKQSIFECYYHHLTETFKKYPQLCLCHNDLNPSNVLLHGSHSTFLDWEYAGLNSPYFDIASVIELFQLSDKQSQEFTNAYWGGFGQQADLDAVKEFQIIVRFVNWLWFSIGGDRSSEQESLEQMIKLEPVKTVTGPAFGRIKKS